jgi:hypothetical protein
MTVAVRFTTMPVKATFFSMASGQPGPGPYCCMVATPSGNGRIKMNFEYRNPSLGGNKQLSVPEWEFSLDIWYLFTIINVDVGLYFAAQALDTVRSGGNIGAVKFVDLAWTGWRWGGSSNFYRPNATWNPAPGQPLEACDVAFGTSIYQGWSSMYVDSRFNYDIAWIHYFDQNIREDDIRKDAACEWLYTQFPKSLNSY